MNQIKPKRPSKIYRVIVDGELRLGEGRSRSFGKPKAALAYCRELQAQGDPSDSAGRLYDVHIADVSWERMDSYGELVNDAAEARD